MSSESQDSHPDYSELLSKLCGDFSVAAQKTISDFFQSMPADYFASIPAAMQIDHLKAIIYGESLKIPPKNFLIKDSAGTKYTFISLLNEAGQLADFLKQIPEDLNISGAKVFTSKDNKFIVDVIDCGPQESGEQSSLGSVERAIATEIAGQETCRISINKLSGKYSEVGILLDNHSSGGVFKKIAEYFSWRSLDIRSASMQSLSFQDSNVAVIKIEALLENVNQQQLIFELQRLLYSDRETIGLARALNYDFDSAEVINAAVNLVHQILSQYDRVYFSHGRIAASILKKRDLIYPYVKRFVEFHKNSESAGAFQISNEETEKLLLNASSSQSKEMLKQFVNVLNFTKSTNLHLSQRASLAISLEPEIFINNELTEIAHKIFYVIGRGFDGFHVRFSEVARGGLRIIPAQSTEHYTHEHERHFEEAYNLAKAQHLKNKDIPEGGSKAVVLVVPKENINMAAKLFVDGLLDLCFNSKQQIPDFVYLGPDENVSNQLICWIEERAKRRGHPRPQVFMSSKPNSGINHKQYGITSEGVNVFLQEALRARGIDPYKQKFTVKITGGTNGDVAGNLIRIMIRDYGSNVQILGIADGTGSVEDPEGLNHQELLRLQKEDLPLQSYNKTLLSSQGYYADISTAEGFNQRNTLHNRLITDVFVPAGGRPKTINSRNVRLFFTESGVPSSKIIVEGANLFLTDNARKELAAAGVLIFKDSSANKCGVICSSYEILAGMLLDPEQFIQIKDVYVPQVIQKLRELAAAEARVLLRGLREFPELSMTELSIKLSRAINQTAAVLTKYLNPQSFNLQTVKELLAVHIPDVLLQKLPDLQKQLNPIYLQKLLATIAARKIIYSEGINSFSNLNEEVLIETVTKYLDYEKDISELLNSLDSLTASQKNRISELLKNGGAGLALKMTS